MSALRSLMLVLVLLSGTDLWSYAILPDSASNKSALNIPFHRYGLSIGNSSEFNGLRINFADRDVKLINGVNITLWHYRLLHFREWGKIMNHSSQINGLSFGTIPAAGSMNGLNIGVLGLFSTKGNLNGASIGGIAIASAARINGFSFSSIITQGGKLSGFNSSGLLIAGAEGINGIATAGLVVSSDRYNINGLAVTPGLIYCGNNFRGAGIAGLFLHSGNFYGLSVAAWSQTEKMVGLSIAIFNSTKELHGIQAGILNYAGNNRKGLRLLPLLNLHLK